MNIILSNASDAPIYEQIARQVKRCILAGELRAGDGLPSIRMLAKDLRISVITTKRAYDELEKDGYIHTVAGKGCYVAEKNVALAREANLREIERSMRRIRGLAMACGLTEEEVVEMFKTLLTAEESQP